MDFLLRNLVIFAIAPCVGAWIEVTKQPAKKPDKKSHPPRVRGLKYSVRGRPWHGFNRTPRGCVD